MSEEVIRLVTELLEAWNSHDVERVAALYAPDYEEVDVAQALPQHGLDGLRRTVARYMRAFPDLHLTGDDMIIQGGRVALAWTLRGTHQGTLMNIPPTGRVVAVRGMTMLTVESGKLARGWRLWDVAGLLRALGLLPEL